MSSASKVHVRCQRRRRALSVTDAAMGVRSGDILLLRSAPSISSYLIMRAQGHNAYSHIAVVVRNPATRVPYVLSTVATGYFAEETKLRDVFGRDGTTGARMYTFDDYVRSYVRAGGQVALRVLTPSLDDKRAWQWALRVHGHPYPRVPWVQLPGAYFSRHAPSALSTAAQGEAFLAERELHCAALVAAAYQHFGVVRARTHDRPLAHWLPCDFSERDAHLLDPRLAERGYALSAEVRVVVVPSVDETCNAARGERAPAGSES